VVDGRALISSVVRHNRPVQTPLTYIFRLFEARREQCSRPVEQLHGR
jgi:hypothetical protein